MKFTKRGLNFAYQNNTHTKTAKDDIIVIENIDSKLIINIKLIPLFVIIATVAIIYVLVNAI